MKQRKVHVPAVVDWHWIGQTGLMEGIEPYLDKAFNSIHGKVVCMGWRRLFEIQEVEYKELVIEFLAMISFARKHGIFAKDNLSFCPGGERRTLSLADFAIRTEIYLPAKAHSEPYQQYIAKYVPIIEGFRAEAHWNEIANGKAPFPRLGSKEFDHTIRGRSTKETNLYTSTFH
ncbi:unnamed protein product [Lactuca virosa]|uniref:Uncharacterized protein n=1 Tax=Lactuca virosa TaxID=75947 RepID=A0AAU9PC49_9ASTR|nr:unnamed protein product [Lactuca virosa]